MGSNASRWFLVASQSRWWFCVVSRWCFLGVAVFYGGSLLVLWFSLMSVILVPGGSKWIMTLPALVGYTCL